MSYNILNKNVNFQGATQGTIEDLVDTHTTQLISGSKDFLTLTGSNVYVKNELGIGTAAPAKHLHIYGSSGEVELRIQSDTSFTSIIQKDNNELIIQNAASNGVIILHDDTAERMRIDSNGKVGIGTNNPPEILSIVGNLSGSGNINVVGNIAGAAITCTTVSGSGNISGSAFYGTWSGANINGSQIQLASGKGLADSTGLTLSTSGVTAQNSPGGSSKIWIDESGIKYATISNILSNNAAVTAYGTQGASKVVLGAGGSEVAGAANLNFFGGNTLAITGALSASTNLELGGTVRLDGVAAATPAVANDKVYFLDADDSLVKASTFANFSTAIAGAGLANNSGVLDIQTSGAVNVVSDKLGITGSFADLGLAYSGAVGAIESIKFDPNSLADTAINRSNDYVIFIDADDNNPKKEQLVDLVGFIAGSGLDASSGQLSVDVSDFLANGSDNRIVTATGADAINGEANFSFNGTAVMLTGSMEMSGSGLTIRGAEAGAATITLVADQGDDASDTCTISVADGGHMTLDVAGLLSLDADGGSIFIKDAGSEFSSFHRVNIETSAVYAGGLLVSASAGPMKLDSFSGDFLFASGSVVKLNMGSDANNAFLQPSGDAANDIIFKDGDESGNEILRFDGSARSVVYSNATKTIFTPSSVHNFTGDDANATIPITSTYAKIDANGSVRTGMRFGGAGTAGQFLIVENAGGENVTFHATGGTALITTNTDNDTMMPGEVFTFISNGSAWFIMGGDLQAG